VGSDFLVFQTRLSRLDSVCDGRAAVARHPYLRVQLAAATVVLEESIKGGEQLGHFGCATRSPDPAHELPHLLRPRGERRGEEAVSKRADEGSSVHYSIT